MGRWHANTAIGVRDNRHLLTASSTSPPPPSTPPPLNLSFESSQIPALEGTLKPSRTFVPSSQAVFDNAKCLVKSSQNKRPDSSFARASPSTLTRSRKHHPFSAFLTDTEASLLRAPPASIYSPFSGGLRNDALLSDALVLPDPVPPISQDVSYLVSRASALAYDVDSRRGSGASTRSFQFVELPAPPSPSSTCDEALSVLRDFVVSADPREGKGAIRVRQDTPDEPFTTPGSVYKEVEAGAVNRARQSSLLQRGIMPSDLQSSLYRSLRQRKLQAHDLKILLGTGPHNHLAGPGSDEDSSVALGRVGATELPAPTKKLLDVIVRVSGGVEESLLPPFDQNVEPGSLRDTSTMSPDKKRALAADSRRARSSLRREEETSRKKKADETARLQDISLELSRCLRTLAAVRSSIERSARRRGSSPGTRNTTKSTKLRKRKKRTPRRVTDESSAPNTAESLQLVERGTHFTPRPAESAGDSDKKQSLATIPEGQPLGYTQGSRVRKPSWQETVGSSVSGRLALREKPHMTFRTSEVRTSGLARGKATPSPQEKFLLSPSLSHSSQVFPGVRGEAVFVASRMITAATGASPTQRDTTTALASITMLRGREEAVSMSPFPEALHGALGLAASSAQRLALQGTTSASTPSGAFLGSPMSPSSGAQSRVMAAVSRTAKRRPGVIMASLVGDKPPQAAIERPSTSPMSYRQSQREDPNSMKLARSAPPKVHRRVLSVPPPSPPPMPLAEPSPLERQLVLSPGTLHRRRSTTAIEERVSPTVDSSALGVIPHRRSWSAYARPRSDTQTTASELTPRGTPELGSTPHVGDTSASSRRPSETQSGTRATSIDDPPTSTGGSISNNEDDDSRTVDSASHRSSSARRVEKNPMIGPYGGQQGDFFLVHQRRHFIDVRSPSGGISRVKTKSSTGRNNVRGEGGGERTRRDSSSSNDERSAALIATADERSSHSPSLHREELSLLSFFTTMDNVHRHGRGNVTTTRHGPSSGQLSVDSLLTSNGPDNDQSNSAALHGPTLGHEGKGFPVPYFGSSHRKGSQSNSKSASDGDGSIPSVRELLGRLPK